MFIVASASHWLLDTIVHKKDLPVLGFGKDRTVGLGLWNRGPLAFVIELILYVVVTMLVVPGGYVVPLLVIGFLFHMINANSFFRFSAKNPFGSPRVYAAAALVGFAAFILLADGVLTGIL